MENSPRPKHRLIIGGYLSLGLLVGYVCGLTESEIANTIVTALFALVGGKILNDIIQEKTQQLNLLGGLLMAFCISFFIGLNSGIYIRIKYHTTTTISQNIPSPPLPQNTPTTNPQPTPEPLLRNDLLDRSVIQQYRKNEITKDSLANYFIKNAEK